MEYEIVNLEEKKAVGISAVTNNKSSEMSKIIGGLWDFEEYQAGDDMDNMEIHMYISLK